MRGTGSRNRPAVVRAASSLPPPSASSADATASTRAGTDHYGKVVPRSGKETIGVAGEGLFGETWLVAQPRGGREKGRSNKASCPPVRAFLRSSLRAAYRLLAGYQARRALALGTRTKGDVSIPARALTPAR